jgi:endo-1,4-beta-mannosidase
MGEEMREVFAIIFSILLLGCGDAENKPGEFDSPDNEQIYNVIKKLTDTITTYDKKGILSVFTENATILSSIQNGNQKVVTKAEYSEILSSWKLQHWKETGLKSQLIGVKAISIEGRKAKATVTIKFYGNRFSGLVTQKYLLVKDNGQWLIEQLS